MQIWTRALMMSAAAAALTFSSCGDKDKDTPTTEKKEAAAVITPAKVAELGFISQLPSDTAVVAAIYKPNDLWQKIRGSAFIRTGATSGGRELPDDYVNPSSEEQKVLSIIGEEIVFAMYGDVATNAAKLSEAYGKLMETLYKSSGIGVFGGLSANGPENTLVGLGSILSLSQYAKDMDITPTIVALKNSEAAYNDLKQAFDVTLKQGADESEGVIVPATHTLDGITYTGYQMKGSAIKESNPQVKELLDALKDKTAYLLLGRKGDYTILYLGKNTEDLRYAESPEKSAATSPNLAFVGDYSAKPLFVSMVSKEIIDVFLDWAKKSNKMQLDTLITQIDPLLNMGVLQDPDGKIKNGLTALTSKISEFYDFTYSSTSAPLQTYAWMDKGLNVDFIFSADAITKSMDMSTPLAFTEIATDQDTILFYEGNLSGNYYTLSTELLYEAGSLIQTLGEVAANSDAILEQNPAIPMFSGPVLSTTKTIGSAIKKALSEGLGTDGALVISTAPEGSPLPVDFALLQTVKDKAKVQEATDEIIQAGRTLGTMFGPIWESVPALKTDTYKAGTEEMTRYSLEPSEMTQGVNPGVLLGAKTLIKGSSLPYVEKLAAKTLGTGDRKGCFMQINIPALNKAILPHVDDEDGAEILKALEKDIKAINYDVIIKGDKSTSTFRFITE